MADQHSVRCNKLRRSIKREGAHALLVTNFTNVTYLTGFSGDDSYLLVRPDGETLLSDPRYQVQLQEECPDLDCEIRAQGVSMLKSIAQVTRSAKIGRLGIEAGSLTVALQAAIATALPQVELVPCNGLVENLRLIKDRQEIKALRTAAGLAERAFAVIRSSLRADQTERAIAHQLEHQIRLFGGNGCSFPPIVAAGARAALPHASATSQPIDSAGFVLIDWGADEPGGYKSDLTRVLVTGKISPKLERIYQVVLKAQQRAIAAIRPGAKAADVDAVARDTIGKAGFGKYFGHGLGHGLGLDIHEAPRLASNSEVVLQPGMVVTVEPGVYLPGFGGVRIEDDVLITRQGHDVLTSTPKAWDEMFVPI
ncbi:MAG: M24 family metallopeptidase [Planctomycetales bacterium]|nr:M24 family metallopeptidase [Planctomycetales bacterium]NIM09609.1 M24 family metallopeptidase [Planctomycetales bacterium]NIN09098.1 M24 family metallopeptidase [Planctomycetales bacterium]NIN78205.1 M24 family metallopeptidase [Planctomycetales bacterium]NIO35396.1 M24 family metallopeptidase [Planctomycetales bacterium]